MVGESAGTGMPPARKRPKPSKSGLCGERVLVVRIAEVHQFGVSASGIEATTMAKLNR
jgi:hypothetical protein